MTPTLRPCTKSVLLRGLLQPLAIVLLAIAASSAGCTTARHGDETSGGRASTEPDAWKLPFSDEELQVLGTHISPTLSAEFTADGKWIVVAGTDGVTIHDAASTKTVNWFNAALVEVSPDGAMLIVKHPNGAPELRSIPDGRLVWRLPAEIATSPLHFSDDARYIVCGYHALLRIDDRQVVYRAPKNYRFDTIHGGNHYQDPADHPPQDDADEDRRAAKLSILPHIYRTTLRDDGRPLITLRSRSCSPAGRFLIVQTGEQDSSYEPVYSFIHRETGERLFADVSSRDALFFHNDDYVLYGDNVHRTDDGKVLYKLEPGVTASALNSDETLLAVGWRNGQVAVLQPVTGEELFRLTVEEHLDTRSQKRGELVSLAFSADSAALAAVGRKLTIIDVPSQTVSSVVDLGPGSRRVGEPETTSPAQIAFNADGSRLLLTGLQGDEYLYARAKAYVVQSADLRKRRALCSLDYFDRQTIPPVSFNSDAAWALLPEDGRGRLANLLRLWNTEADQPLVDIPPQTFQRYRQGYVVPDSPKRQLGLGRFRGWHAGKLVFYPWSIDAIQKIKGMEIPDGAREWLQTFVYASPYNTARHINGTVLSFPPKQWVLSIFNNRVLQLWDLSTGEPYPPDLPPLTGELARELDAIDVPETCWGLAGVEANAFSPDGSRLLLYRRTYRPNHEHLLALFEMPSGRMLRHYKGHAHIGRIHIAPNNRIAAISTDFYTKTWIIDLETGETLVELPHGGKCVFSPDSRYAQVGDRYGQSRSLLTIETGDLLDFRWARRWAFSPNNRYAIGGTGRSWFFLDLATGEKTSIPGEIHPTGVSTPSSTKLDFPYQGSRFLSVEKGVTRLYDADAAEMLAEFDPVAIASETASRLGKIPDSYAPAIALRYSYAPNDQYFVVTVGGSSVQEAAGDDQSETVPRGEPAEFSTQILIGDLKTGSEIQCSTPVWSRKPLRHQFFTPDGTHLITISPDKMMCWRLHPPELAWETNLLDRWTDPETGEPFASEETLNWFLDYMIHPGDQSILIAADGREAIMFCLATGEEQQRFGPLPINSVLRFGSDGVYLQVAFRSNRSMRLYHVSSGEPIRTYHFTDGGTQLHRFRPSDL